MDLWKEVIKALHAMRLPTPGVEHLKPAFLAQWMLETGRGTSKAFLDFLNVAGMKWRPEMANIAEKVWYKTDSEDYKNGPNGWEKGDWFCRFNSIENAIKGYFVFLDRSPYHGWKSNTNTATDFLSFIGPTWCPGGYKPEWMAKHNGHTYHEYIVQELFPEAVALLKALGDVPDSIPGTATWFECNRTDKGEAVISAMTPDGKSLSNLLGSPAVTKDNLSEFLAFFKGASTILVAETNKKVIPAAPAWPQVVSGNNPPPADAPLKGIKILLDPGHSERAPGAYGKGPNPPQEYEMNLLQARILADRFRAAGATVLIVDPDPDNLEQVALRANGMDLYIALHHNAANANGIDEGTETHIHPLANNECAKLALRINTAVVKALGTKDRGVKRTAYTVLSVSTKQTNCKLNILTESYFIDDYSDKETTITRSRKAAHAIGQAVEDYFMALNDDEEVVNPAVKILEPFSGTRKFKRGDNVYLTENFHLSEYECRCGCGETLVDGDHIQKLQKFREKIGKPVRINSAYRCPAYNAKIGGASDSRHMYGDATDITADGIPPSVVYANADNIFDGVGKYNTFTHVDSRGYRARWNG